MSNLDVEFQKAIQRVHSAPRVNPPSDEVRLCFYANYKQAIEGDIHAAAPSVFRFRARAKWNAWNQVKGLSTTQAKVNYIKLTNTYMP